MITIVRFFMIIFLSVLGSALHATPAQEQTEVADQERSKTIREPLVLESKVVEIVDGKPGIGIGAPEFGAISKLRHEAQRCRDGIKQADGSMRGVYEFQGAFYTSKELVVLEQQGADVSKTLAWARDDIHKKIQPLLIMGKGSKPQMVMLIREWSGKARRLDSYLLTWATTPEGLEKQSLDAQMTSFKIFDQFLDDLIYYLETMLRSCPKAYKMFKDLVEQKLQQQHIRP